MRGIELVKAIHSSTMKAQAYYILSQFQHSEHLGELEGEIDDTRAGLEQDLVNLQLLFDEYSEYKKQSLDEGIKTLHTLLSKKSSLDIEDFTQIETVLTSFRTGNYHIGDISTLNYEGEKDIYLFASVIIHHLPELLGELGQSRALLVHGLIEKNFDIDMHNAIVQSMSQISLSQEELRQTVQILTNEYDSGAIQELLKKIDFYLGDMNDVVKDILGQKDLTLSSLAFYHSSKKISELANELYDENLRLLSSVMQERNRSLKDDIVFSRTVILFISVISLLAIILEFISTRRTLKRERITDELLIQTQDAVDAFTLVCKTDAAGVLTYVNRRFCEVSGYSEEELIGSSYKSMRHPDMPAEFFEQMWEQIQNKQLWTGKVKNQNKDGEAFYINMLIKPIIDEKKHISEYIAISVDITELEMIRTQLENDLKISETSLYQAYVDAMEQTKRMEDQKELYELVFKNTASSVLIIDIEANRFIDCNEPAIDMLRCDSKEDVLDLQPAQLSPEFQPDGRRSDEKSDEMNALAVERGSHTFEWKHLRKDGEEIWVEVVLTPIILNKKKVLHVVWKDIEDRKQAAIEREEQQMLMIQQSRLASMGEMIGNISHQWRQPLNALGLTLQKLNLLKSRGILDEKRLKESVDKSMSLIYAMSSTIDDFRDFFNPNKEKSAFLVSEAVQKSYSIVEASFEHSGIVYTSEIDSDIEIQGYKNEFSQVILNLFNNARDALLERKVSSAQVMLRAKKVEDHVVISVCDNAGGIPKESISKVFEPYFTTKEEGKGTGIGLYMSKMIIEDHMDGKFDVSNTDEGACFSIRFSQVD